MTVACHADVSHVNAAQVEVSLSGGRELHSAGVRSRAQSSTPIVGYCIGAGNAMRVSTAGRLMAMLASQAQAR